MSSGHSQVLPYPMASPARHALTDISLALNRMAGRSPISAAVRSNTGDPPYSMIPGLTQSRWLSGRLTTAAEFASE